MTIGELIEALKIYNPENKAVVWDTRKQEFKEVAFAQYMGMLSFRDRDGRPRSGSAVELDTHDGRA